MRRNRLGRKGLFLMAVLAACMLTTVAHQAGTGLQDEDAIRQSVQQMQEGWNTKSGALFAKPFAEDADYVVINGRYIKGQKVIAEAHQRIFDTIYKNTSISLKVERSRLLRPDVALVHVLGRAETPQADGASKSDVILTLVMTKNSGVWQIAAFQNTKVEARP